MATMSNCLVINSHGAFGIKSPKVFGINSPKVIGTNRSRALVIRSSVDPKPIHELTRKSFPTGFLFGTASSAYQVEGAAAVDGRGPSIWDTFTHDFPEKIADGSNGDVACDSYNRYKEDVQIIDDIGFDSYRFSISWSRIFPTGKVKDGVNQAGVDYYNNLIDELRAKNIEPCVTLFHWDSPQACEDEYYGFRDSKIVDDFADYADFCFKTFGKKVKYWITINEPSTFTIHGYVLGIHAPNRCSPWQDVPCVGGDCSTEPYIASHNILLAHAAAVKIYKEKYQADQEGFIGITIVSYWMEPYSDKKEDKDAARRALDFMLGWYLHPVTYGEYPESMRTLVGDRLPKFEKEQSEMLKDSFDFIGINYYTARYVVNSTDPAEQISYTTDSRAVQLIERDGVSIGTPTGSGWLYSYPKGLRDLLLYVKDEYKNPPVYITENGVSEPNTAGSKSLEEQLNDGMRIKYYSEHLQSVKEAIELGAQVKGFFAWTLMDNFEWEAGYTVRFGMNYVDFNDGLKRYPKASANFFKRLLNHGAN